jgi:hypothetical protein
VPELPDVITQAVHDAMVEQARAENDAVARMILDSIAGYNALHAEVTGICTNIFSSAPCRFDEWLVSRVAQYG